MQSHEVDIKYGTSIKQFREHMVSYKCLSFHSLMDHGIDKTSWTRTKQANNSLYTPMVCMDTNQQFTTKNLISFHF